MAVEKRSFVGHPVHSSTAAPMPIKRILTVSALLFLLSVPFAFAGDTAASYLELTDAPTITVDWSKGSTQTVTLGGNRSFTFLNGQKGGKYLLIVKQDAHGSRTVTWPVSVHWPGGPPPTLTTLAAKTDYITFFYNGANYDALGFAQNL
jgi:hypothetical protein